MAVSLGWGQGAHWVQVTGPEAQEFPAVGASWAVQLAVQPVVLTPLPQTVGPTQLWEEWGGTVTQTLLLGW